MHESLSGLGESEGTFDDSATAKMMREKDEKGIIGEPVSQSFETPRKTPVALAKLHGNACCTGFLSSNE